MGLGIKKEVKGKNKVQWMPNPEKPVAVGFLVNVEQTWITKKNDDEKVPVLNFEFANRTKEAFHTHTEWLVEFDDKKADMKIEMMQERIKHMYCAFTGDYDVELGVKAKYTELSDDASADENAEINKKNYENFFIEIAKHFNEDGAKGNKKQPIYKDEEGNPYPLWVILTINSYTNRPSLPGYPNFIERFVKDKNHTIQVDRNYHKFVQEESNKSNANVGGGTAQDAGLGASGAPDLPDLP